MSASAIDQLWNLGAKSIEDDLSSQIRSTRKEPRFSSSYPDTDHEQRLGDEVLAERKHLACTRAQSRELRVRDSYSNTTTRPRDEVTSFVSLLRTCAKSKDLARGRIIHGHLSERGLVDKCSDALISMYSRCGSLYKAQDLLDVYGSKNAFCWTAVIVECTRHGLGQEALVYYERMQSAGFSPDAVTLSCVLKACGISKDAKKGEQIHDLIARKGFLEKDPVLGTALVDMYAKCNALSKAQKVLEDLPLQDVTSWNALINGFAQEGKVEQAFTLFEQMRNEGFSPNAVTFICMLKACSNKGAIHRGEQVYDEIARQGLLQHNPKLVTALVDMYAKCGATWKAQEILENLGSRNSCAWSSLIAGFTQQGLAQQALDCHDHMQGEGIPSDSVTLASILKACGALGAVKRGEKIHDEIRKQSLLKDNIILGVALLDMYVKCGAIMKAQEVFDGLPSCNVVAWNALLTGYTQQGLYDRVLSCFKQMQHDGISPDFVTYACILKACGALNALEEGKQVHEEIFKQGLLQNNISLGTALLDMYAKVGALTEAKKAFDELPSRDVVSWSALIAGYAQHGPEELAFACFEQMQREDVSPDVVTFASILKACGQLKAIDRGKCIHNRITEQGFLGKNVVLGNALVDMYVKCGDLGKAVLVLKDLPSRDAVSYSALMVGYICHGQSKRALDCFQCMQDEGIQPDAMTYCCVLSACSHLGLVEEGHLHFVNMTMKYGLEPSIEHYTCMVDLFGRAGHIEKAAEVIQEMPFSNCYVLWCALLGACRKWRDVKIARWAFERAVQLDKSNATAYVLMATTYTIAGMEEEAKRVEDLRLKNKAQMKSIHSPWIRTFSELGDLYSLLPNIQC